MRVTVMECFKVLFISVGLLFLLVDGKSPILSNIPDSYLTGVVVELVPSNKLYVGTEHYDKIIGKAAMSYRDLHNKEHWNLFDYKSEVGQSLVESSNFSWKCLQPFDVSATTGLFTFVQLAQTLIKQNGTFVEETIVRNISCCHWRLNFNNTRFDFYFEKMRFNEMLIPIQIVTSNISSSTVYDYYDFNTDSSMKKEFKGPSDTVCAAGESKEAPELPEKLTMTLEYHFYVRRNISNLRDIVIYSKIHFDFGAKIYRFDHYTRYHHRWTVVKDILHTEFGLRYEIFSPLHCEIMNFTAQTIPKDIFHYSRKRRERFLFTKDMIHHYNSNRQNYTYDRQTLVRSGIPADVWVYRNQNTSDVSTSRFNITEIEWYFIQNQTIELSSNDKKRQLYVPIQIGLRMRNGQYIRIHVFDFSGNVHENSILSPLRHCLDLYSSVYTMTLFLRGLADDQLQLLHNQTGLANTIIGTLESFTSISRARFSIELVTTRSQIDVQLSIFDHPFKNTATMNDGVPAKKVADKIKRAVLQNDIKLKFPAGNNTYEVYFKKAYFDGVSMVFSDKDRVCNKVHPTKQNIMIILIFVALFFGCAITLCILQLRLKQNGYNLKAMLRSVQRLDEPKPQTTSGLELSDE